MLAGIGKCLLGGAVQGHASVGSESTRLALDSEFGTVAGGQGAELLGQFYWLVSQGVYRLARLI